MNFHGYILLGLVQGIGEFLPISSSGHLIIAKHFINVPNDIVLDVTLHLATLFAVIIYYKKDLVNLTKSAYADSIKSLKAKKVFISQDTKYVLYILVACVPTFTLGFLFKNYFENNRSLNTVLIMLVAVSIFMLFDVLSFGLKNKKLNYKNVFFIGFLQTFALIPGASRSGITITTASLLGIPKLEAARFSFLLSIPAILAAFTLSVVDIKDFNYFLNFNLVGAFIVAFLSGLLSIKILVNVLAKFGFLPFIVYRIFLVLAVIILIY